MDWGAYRELNERLIENEQKKLVTIRRNDLQKAAELQQIEHIKVQCTALAKEICNYGHGEHGRRLEEKGLSEYIPSTIMDANVTDLRDQYERERHERWADEERFDQIPDRTKYMMERNEVLLTVYNFIKEQILFDEYLEKHKSDEDKDKYGYGSLAKFMAAMNENVDSSDDPDVKDEFHLGDITFQDSYFDEPPDDLYLPPAYDFVPL